LTTYNPVENLVNLLLRIENFVPRKIGIFEPSANDPKAVNLCDFSRLEISVAQCGAVFLKIARHGLFFSRKPFVFNSFYVSRA